MDTTTHGRADDRTRNTNKIDRSESNRANRWRAVLFSGLGIVLAGMFLIGILAVPANQAFAHSEGYQPITVTSLTFPPNSSTYWVLEPEPGVFIEMVLTGAGMNLVNTVTLYLDGAVISTIAIPSVLSGAGSFTMYIAIGGYLIEVPIQANSFGKQEPQVIDSFPSNHEFTQVGRVNPTCLNDGFIVYLCALHGDSYVEVIPALGHQWGVWIVTTPATCLEDGIETRTCERDSSHVEMRSFPALGHQWGVWIVTTPASCLTDGVDTRICERDSSHIETRTTDAIGHQWGAWTVKTPPTCLEEGIEVRICERDISHIEVSDLPALGHQWGAWTVTTPATCLEDGVETRVCERDSSHIETQPLDALGHLWGARESDPLWKTRSHPDPDAEGHPLAGGTRIVCQRAGCGVETDFEPIYGEKDKPLPPKPSTPTTPTAPPSDKGSVPKTGDMLSASGLLLFLMGGSLIAVRSLRQREDGVSLDR